MTLEAMPANLRRLVLFVAESVAVLAFFMSVLAAELLSRLLTRHSHDEQVSVYLATGLFALMQRSRYGSMYKDRSATLSAAYVILSRHFVTSAIIPCLIFAAGIVSGFVLGDVEPGALFGLGGYVFVLWLLGSPANSGPRVLRGTEIILFQEALRRAANLIRPGEPTIVLGNLRVPERISEGHIGIAGTTGSGKSLSLRYLLQSILPSLGQFLDARAVIYDAKRDILPILHGMNLDLPIIVFNPFDARSYAWDIAGDLTDPASAMEVASILIPTRRNDAHPFFAKAARAVLAGVLRVFMLTRPKQWSLRDVVITVSDPAILKSVLSQTPAGQKLLAQYSEPETVFLNTLQTIATEFATLEPIAALWASSPRKITLREWVTSKSILVLGSDWEYSEAMKSVNRLIFRRLTQLVLNASESRDRRTWFVIDELKEAGQLDGLTSLMSYGRSKGVRVALAFQDIDGLRHVFEERPANEIIGLCRNKSLLRIDSESTARWAAQTIGEALGVEYTKSVTRSSQGDSEATTEHIYKRDAVLPSELMRLPPPDEESFTGYHIIPSIGVFKSTWKYRSGLSPQGDIPEFTPRPAADQLITPWTPDEARFKAKAPSAPDSSLPSAAPRRIEVRRVTRKPSDSKPKGEKP